MGLFLIASIIAPARIATYGEEAPLTSYSYTDEIKDYIVSQAKLYNVDPDVALWIVSHESQFNPLVVGDDGKSRGLWQIHSGYNSSVSDSCSFSKECSTKWSMEQLSKGKQNLWSTWRFRCKWFVNENPPNCKK